MKGYPSVYLAQPSDCLSLMALFKACTTEMLANGIGQWHYDYPTREGVEADILNGEVYLWKEKAELLGTITLNEQQSEQYQQIHWKIKTQNTLVIHRLAVAPSAQRRGIAYQLCQFAEAHGLQNGYDTIRLDAYSANKGSNSLYKKLAYQLADGQCWFHNNEFHFNCWEKKLL